MDEVTRQLQEFKDNDPNGFAKAILQLSEKELEEILYSWPLWARDKQIAPEGKWRYWVVLGGRSSGKLFYPDTDVLTVNRGWIKFENIKVGDQVFDENGKPCNVTAVYRPFLGDISQTYELTFSDKTTLKTCGDHKWVTWTHRDRKQFLRKEENGRDLPEDWVNFTGDVFHSRWPNPVGQYGPTIKTTQEIVDTLFIGKRQDNNHSIPLAKPLQFKYKKTEIDPYVYAYWLGDGCRGTSTFTIDKQDQSHFIKQCEKVGYEVSIHKCPKTVSVKGLITKLKKQNTPTKEVIPDDYLHNSYDVRLSFLQGLLDSDGYAYESGVEFCSKTKTHAEIVYYIAASLGQKPTLFEGDAKLNGVSYGTKYRVYFQPIDIIPFRLPRKAKIIEELIEGRLNKRKKIVSQRMIVGAKPIDPVEGMLCITVDSPNSMWLVGKNLIPTHNTRTGSEWVIERAKQQKGPIALVGQTKADVRDVQIEIGPSSILQVSPPNFRPTYEPSKRRVTWPNGVVATIFSGDEPGQLRGPQHQTVWCDELPKYDNPGETYNQIEFGLRIGDSRAIVTTTPTPDQVIKDFYLDWKKDPNGRVRLVVMTSHENKANLDPEYFASVEARLKGTRLYRQEMLGEILWDSVDALFTQETIDKYRVKEEDQPEYINTVISIDPAVTNNKNSDHTALTVCSVDERLEGYVRYSKKMKCSPMTWAKMAVALYDEFEASHITVETNNGGDLIKSTLDQVRRNLPIKEVRASKNKIARMEPISLLAEQGKVHIVGHQPDLEDQLVQYNGKGQSPDLYDSACWGLTDLMLNKKNEVYSSEFYF